MSSHIDDFSREIFVGGTYHSFIAEVRKGCVKDVLAGAVCLEPFFESFDPTRIYREGKSVRVSVPYNVDNSSWFVCRMKVPLFDKVDWDRFDFLLSRLSAFSGVVSFEIFGNKERVEFFVGSSSVQLVSVLRGVLQGVFPELVVVEADDPFVNLDSSSLRVFDLFPMPPYHRRMSCGFSSLAGFLKTISALPRGEFGFFQALFVPVRNDWQGNVSSLLKAEAVLDGRCPFGRTSSGMVKDLSRPFFSVAVRFGCVSKDKGVVGALRNFCGSFLHSGKPFCFRTERDFAKVLGREKVSEMLVKRIAYCPGFVLDSGELANFVHFPDSSVKCFGVRLDVARGFRVPERLLQDGRPLGFNYSSGRKVLVRLPASEHNKSLWLLGRSRYGKSNSMKRQAAYHAERGDGVCFIDPHRLAAFEFLGMLSPKAAERVVFLDFDDEEYVLDYNPFDEGDEESFGRLSVEFVNSFKHLFDAVSFHRMSHLLRMAVYALFVLGKNLSSIPVLFSRSSSGELLRKEVVARANNGEVRRFWREEFYAYPREAFAPVVNRFSELLMDARALRVFSREKNKVRIDRAMDEGKILVVALPSSVDVACVVGGLLLAQLQKAGLARTGRGAI